MFFKSSAAVDKFPEIFGVRLIGRGGGTGDGGLLDASDNVSGVANGAVRELSSQSLRRFDLRIQRKKIIFNTVLEIKQEGKKKKLKLQPKSNILRSKMNRRRII